MEPALGWGYEPPLVSLWLTPWFAGSLKKNQDEYVDVVGLLIHLYQHTYRYFPLSLRGSKLRELSVYSLVYCHQLCSRLCE